MSDIPVSFGIFNPSRDLDEKLKLHAPFSEAAKDVNQQALLNRELFEEFRAGWEPLLEHIAAVRDSGKCAMPGKDLCGRIFLDQANKKIKLLIGFTKPGEELGELNAGLLFSAPLGRIEYPEGFFEDYKTGLNEGLFTNMGEQRAEAAVRYSLNVEKLSGFSGDFPSIFTPAREMHLFEYVNEWLVQQVLGQPKKEQALDIRF
jgi:hypothetical protein